MTDTETPASPWTDEDREQVLYRLSDCEMDQASGADDEPLYDDDGTRLWCCAEHDSEPTVRDDHCPLAEERADGILVALAPRPMERERAAKVEALRDVVKAWNWSAWSDVLTLRLGAIKDANAVGEWLSARADEIEENRRG